MNSGGIQKRAGSRISLNFTLRLNSLGLKIYNYTNRHSVTNL